MHFSDAKSVPLEDDTGDGLTERLIIGDDSHDVNFRIKALELSKNGCTPWYFYERDHHLFIHSGIGEVLYNNEWIPVTEGYLIFIPKNEEHQIRNRSDAPLIILSIAPAVE